ncbi:hypothetical protein [Microcoleus sp. OTE_8_concoct_300]|uniref:hypothetical protein n=1 Tax=Microcoleus sp. OTE_8_concoct_300 TaxID=2964710 RepID=UPI00403FAC91
MKALREDKLNTAERFVVSGPRTRSPESGEHKPPSTADRSQIRLQLPRTSQMSARSAKSTAIASL